MTFSVKLNHVDRAVQKILNAVGPNARHALYSTAGEGVSILVKDHLRRVAHRRHRTAERLDADPTGHLVNGARAVTWHSSQFGAVVAIPIPGISKAYHDLDIAPVNAKELTLPVDKLAYGRRVSEVRALGWKVFRPKGRDFLMGERAGEVRVLYALKKSVHQRQDPELLPNHEEMGHIASKAMAGYIQRILRKAD